MSPVILGWVCPKLIDRHCTKRSESSLDIDSLNTYFKMIESMEANGKFIKQLS